MQRIKVSPYPRRRVPDFFLSAKAFGRQQPNFIIVIFSLRHRKVEKTPLKMLSYLGRRVKVIFDG